MIVIIASDVVSYALFILEKKVVMTSIPPTIKKVLANNKSNIIYNLLITKIDKMSGWQDLNKIDFMICF